MRIKRFTAPDMRTALRMVRDEQGPDAVILSNRATADGIEVVAATDYDESLVSQALRAAAPGLEAPASAPALKPALAESVAVSAPVVTAFATPKRIEAAPAPERATATVATPAVSATGSARETSTPRESLISRARAIFRIGDGPASDDGPTLAELTAAPPSAAAPLATVPRQADASSRFEEMMAAFNPSAAASNGGPSPAGEPASTGTATGTSVFPAAEAPPADDGTLGPAADSDADYLIALATGRGGPTVQDEAAAVPRPDSVTPPVPRVLHALAGDAAEADPVILAMRRELATMRQLMERQMEQLSLERLRGSPARAAAFEALLGLGCDTAIAQTVAASLDPRIAPSDVQEPMLAGLVRTLALARSEPLDDGGVIALVGPTGAGKTTTAAKLAARFAARHRARDVALVSIDRERTGAREQLHALGRRLGVTVCDADNSDALGRALEQLVDYPLVLVDTAGYGVRDRALLRQILWLRSSSRLRSLLVLPANAHPHDLGEIVRRYRPAAPEGAVLTKLDETGRLGASLSVLAQYGLPLAYTCSGQQVPDDLDAADADALTGALRSQVLERRAVEEHATQKRALEKSSGAADNPLAIEDRHAFA